MNLNNKMKYELKNEDISLRDENKKYYINEDFTKTVALFPAPVHFKLNGEWLDIDNSLIDDENEIGYKQNKANDFKLKLADKARPEGMIKLEKDGKLLTWGIEAEEYPELVIETCPVDPAAAVMTSTVSKAIYSNVFDNVDLEYILRAKTIKENILINEPTGRNEFVFKYRSDELKAVFVNKHVDFTDDEGKTVFSLAAPCAFDAVQAMSPTLSLELINTEDPNEWFIKVIADKEWLQSDERVYPIMIDPTVTTSLSATQIYDTFLSSKNAGDNYAYSYIMKTGKTTGSGILRSFINFELPEMKSADMVVNATFDLTCYSNFNVNKQVNLHRITSSWNPLTVNWNTKPSYDDKLLDYIVFNDTTGKRIEFDVTDVVKDWYVNGNRFGLMIKDSEENGRYTEYLDSDCSEAFAQLRPHLTITYINYSGLEDYWTYHALSAGRAGTTYVNNYNGNLVLTHDTLSLSGNRVPIQLSQVYNTNDKDVNIGYGNGFRLNYHQTINLQTVGSVEYYKYIDADGTEHNFVYKTDEQKWVDESGLDLTLTINTASADKFVISAKKDAKPC